MHLVFPICVIYMRKLIILSEICGASVRRLLQNDAVVFAEELASADPCDAGRVPKGHDFNFEHETNISQVRGVRILVTHY